MEQQLRNIENVSQKVPIEKNCCQYNSVEPLNIASLGALY